MAQQTSYNDNPAAALAGMLVEGVEGEIITKIAEAIMGIGLLAAPGASPMTVPSLAAPISASGGDAGTCKQLPTGTADDPILDSEFIGVPILDMSRMATDQIVVASRGNLSYSAYAQYEAVPLLRKGQIWVYSAEAITTDYGDVYVYGTQQTNIPAGMFGFGAGAGKIKFTRGRWLMKTSGAGLAKLEVW